MVVLSDCLQAIPQSVAGIRNMHNQCPKEVLSFLWDLFKYNDNQTNKVLSPSLSPFPHPPTHPVVLAETSSIAQMWEGRRGREGGKKGGEREGGKKGGEREGGRDRQTETRVCLNGNDLRKYRIASMCVYVHVCMFT